MRELSLKEVREVQINILNTVDEFCKKRNLRYSLAYGTLLGAVRHKGYIPWDDDIDLIMPRPDYELFAESFNSYNEFIKAKSRSLDSRIPFSIIKVDDARTKLISSIQMPANLTLGVNIDIFPIDGLPDDVKLSNKHISKINFVQRIVEKVSIKDVEIDFAERGVIKNILLTIVKLLLIPFPYSWALGLKEKTLRKYDFTTSEYATMSSGTANEIKRVEKEIYENYTSLSFEGKSYPVITKYEYFLNSVYGDYMKLPPLDEQTPPDLKAFAK